MEYLIVRLAIAAVLALALAFLGAVIENATGVWPLIKDLPSYNRLLYRLSLQLLGVVAALGGYFVFTGKWPQW